MAFLGSPLSTKKLKFRLYSFADFSSDYWWIFSRSLNIIQVLQIYHLGIFIESFVNKLCRLCLSSLCVEGRGKGKGKGLKKNPLNV